MSEQDEVQEEKRSFAEWAKDQIEGDRKKWGGMTPGAMGRLGLAELRKAVSHEGSGSEQTPYGMYGTLTPGEVAAERRDDVQVQQMEQEAGRGMEGATAQAELSPGELARHGSVHGSDGGTVHGNEQQEAQGGMTPGELARYSGPSPQSQQQQGNEMHRGRGR